MSVSEPAPASPPKSVGLPRGFILATVIVIVAFSWPLYQLMRFSVSGELYSYIVLIPLISLYLVWQRRATLPAPSIPQRRPAFVLFGAGLAVLAGYGLAIRSGAELALEDSLALTTFSFLCFFSGICSWFLGRATLRAVLFPLAFLLFMLPLPVSWRAWIEMLLQYGSAAVAHAFFSLAGTTVYVDQLTFQLRDITLQVAPECSGIHSSLALLITSALAGYFFLRSPGRRAILALAVIPLALLRNGFRVFVIGELCVRIGPEMIDSPIHHKGGPIFFVLSLIPFFLLLVALVRAERLARWPARSFRR